MLLIHIWVYLGIIIRIGLVLYLILIRMGLGPAFLRFMMVMVGLGVRISWGIICISMFLITRHFLAILRRLLLRAFIGFRPSLSNLSGRNLWRQNSLIGVVHVPLLSLLSAGSVIPSTLATLEHFWARTTAKQYPTSAATTNRQIKNNKSEYYPTVVKYIVHKWPRLTKYTFKIKAH